ncbi:unnamed protein product [Diplocarpon coronariae]
MGWLDSLSEVGSSTSHYHSSHHHSKSKSHSGRSHHGHGLSPRGSGIFGLGDHRHNSSRSSFFGFPSANHRSSSSYYRRSPRTGYLQRMYSKLRRLFRDLVYYMKKHPLKVFILVIMPLITGGALAGLLAKFGIRLPGGLERTLGGRRGGGVGGGEYSGGGGLGRRSSGDLQFERTHMEGSYPRGGGGSGGIMGGLGSVLGGMGGVGGAVSLAKMFM